MFKLMYNVINFLIFLVFVHEHMSVFPGGLALVNRNVPSSVLCSTHLLQVKMDTQANRISLLIS